MVQSELEMFSKNSIDDEVGDNENVAFRPIQYLGSKLRLVKEISEIIESNKTSNIVCDLFSGSGVVSHYLAKNNEVISVDIQYYSSVLSTALTNGRPFSQDEIISFLDELTSTRDFADLQFLFEPLVSLEESLLKTKLQTDSDKLNFAAFIDNCSVYSYLESEKMFSKIQPNTFLSTSLNVFVDRFSKSTDIIKKNDVLFVLLWWCLLFISPILDD